MAASRFPGKVLADICGRPMLEWLLERVASVNSIDQIVLATTDQGADNQLAAWASTHKRVAACFRGSEWDVLDRVHRAAVNSAADLVVRVTADDPLKDPGVIRHAIELCQAQPALDYCSNTLRPSYPEGLDIEVFRFAALDRAHREATQCSEREHVTPYIWKNPQIFRIQQFSSARDLSLWRWTVDKPSDLEFVRAIFSHFRDRPLVPYQDIVAYIDMHPELVEINSGTVRNEGYLKSVKQESL